MEILNSTVYFQKLDLLASLYAGQERLKKQCQDILLTKANWVTMDNWKWQFVN